MARLRTATSRYDLRWQAEVASGALSAGLTRAARAIVIDAKAVTRREPVEWPTRFYLSIKRGAAGKLGLAMPPGLLAQADDVIE